MPLYDYQCDKCGHTCEVFQRMAEDPLKVCPKCQRETLIRLIGTPTIHTDATFTKGRGTLLQQYGGDEVAVNRLVAAAKKQGYSPKATDIYEPCLAKRAGDPAAFLPSTDSVSKLKRLCAKRGIACEGRGINIKASRGNSSRKRAAAKATN